jgi:hypothetical protein
MTVPTDPVLHRGQLERQRDAASTERIHDDTRDAA